MIDQTCKVSPGESGDPVGPLMALLRDSSKDPGGPYVSGRGEFAPRWQAVAGLVKLGSVAVEPLCHALREPNAYTQRFAAEVLRRIGDQRAVPPLLDALQASEIYVQRYVAAALAMVGDERALAPLVAALQTPDVAREALAALAAVLARSVGVAPADLLHLVAQLADQGIYVAEVPDTDGGYLSWERVERLLDYRPVKQLAQQELARRDLAV
jgi:HEAT repeats